MDRDGELFYLILFLGLSALYALEQQPLFLFKKKLFFPLVGREK